jgi:hypothetical protein
MVYFTKNGEKKAAKNTFFANHLTQKLLKLQTNIFYEYTHNHQEAFKKNGGSISTLGPEI